MDGGMGVSGAHKTVVTLTPILLCIYVASVGSAGLLGCEWSLPLSVGYPACPYLRAFGIAS